MRMVSSSERCNSEMIYCYRWVILLLYSLSSMANALMWVTFSPITSATESYLGYLGNLSLINLLAVIFQILYLPGTILGVLCMKSFGLRHTLLIGLSMTTIGALLRLVGTLCYESISPGGLYVLLFLGQVLAALAQPMFVNIPPLIASEWFPASERDIATTVGSFCSPVGNALGQIISVAIVSTDSDGEVIGMNKLMATEMGISASVFLFVFLFFRSKPPTPPSASSRLKDDLDTGDRRALASVDRAAGPMGSAEISRRKTRAEFYELLRNQEYIYLLLAFTIGLGIFNSFMTLINQFVEPQGYTSDDAGNFAAIMIICGLVGAGVMTVILDKTHAYRSCLKLGFFFAFLSLVLFSFMLRPGNKNALYVSFALLGLFILPMLPVVLENCSEVTYPVGEDLPVGLLFIGGNILSIGLTYGLQFLLSKEKWTHSPPWMPSSLLLVILPFVSFLVLLKYNGQYKRLNCDHNIIAPLLPLESMTEESAEHMAERLVMVHGSEAESSNSRRSSAGWTSKRTSNASLISQHAAPSEPVNYSNSEY